MTAAAMPMEITVERYTPEVAVALQGTIDSFALSDVLRLLDASGKTGRLIVNGDRGSASLWMVGGQLVGGSTSGEPHAPEIVDVVFDVLRFGQGSFIFENDAQCPNPSEPMLIIPALEQAEAALAEWLEIVRVVPSLDSVVTLAPELPHPEVVVDQACWTSIVAVGGSVTVTELGNRLGLGELPVCRLVRALVSAGLRRRRPCRRAGARARAGTGARGRGRAGARAGGRDGRRDRLLRRDRPHRGGGPDRLVGAVHLQQRARSAPAGRCRIRSGHGVRARSATRRTTWARSSDPLSGPDAPQVSITGLTDDPFAPESFPGGSSTSLFDRRDGDAGAATEDEEDWSQALSMLSPKAAQAVAAARATTPTTRTTTGSSDRDPGRRCGGPCQTMQSCGPHGADDTGPRPSPAKMMCTTPTMSHAAMLTLGQAIDRRFAHDDPWAHDALAALGQTERDDQVHDVAKGWLRIGGESGTLVDALFVLTASRIGFAQTSHDGVPPQWIPLRSIVALDAIEGVPYPLVTVEVQLSGDVAILVGWPDVFCSEVVEVLTADLAAAARQSAPSVEPETMPTDFADPASTANAADPATLDELDPSPWQEQDLTEPAPGAWASTPPSSLEEAGGTPATRDLETLASAESDATPAAPDAADTQRAAATCRPLRCRQRDGVLRSRRRRAAPPPTARPSTSHRSTSGRAPTAGAAV